MKLCGSVLVAICLGTSSAGFFDDLNPGSLLKKAIPKVDDLYSGSLLEKTLDNVDFNKYSELAKSAVSDVANKASETVIHVADKASETAMDIANKASEATKHVADNIIKAIEPPKAVKDAITSVVINWIRELVKVSNKSVIDLPDMHATRLGVELNATHGFLRDLSTISIAGDTNFTRKGTSFEIGIPVKFDVLETGYNELQASIFWIQRGPRKLQVHIPKNVFVIHLVITPGINCAVSFKKIDVAVLEGMSITIKGFAGFVRKYLIEIIGNIVLEKMKDMVKKNVEIAIHKILAQILVKDQQPICSSFSASRFVIEKLVEEYDKTKKLMKEEDEEEKNKKTQTKRNKKSLRKRSKKGGK